MLCQKATENIPECLATNVTKEKEKQLDISLFLPLLAAASVLSVAQSVSASLPAAAFYILLVPGAVAPAVTAVSEEPQNVPCSPAAVSRNPDEASTHQAR